MFSCHNHFKAAEGIEKIVSDLASLLFLYVRLVQVLQLIPKATGGDVLTRSVLVPEAFEAHSNLVANGSSKIDHLAVHQHPIGHSSSHSLMRRRLGWNEKLLAKVRCLAMEWGQVTKEPMTFPNTTAWVLCFCQLQSSLHLWPVCLVTWEVRLHNFTHLTVCNGQSQHHLIRE